MTPISLRGTTAPDWDEGQKYSMSVNHFESLPIEKTCQF